MDCGAANPTIYVWSGSKSSPAKKTKGAALAEILKNHERSGHATIVKVDNAADEAAFWAALGGGNPKEIAEKWPFGTDEYLFKIFYTPFFSFLAQQQRRREDVGRKYEIISRKYRVQ